jgi:hypothetical protein
MSPVRYELGSYIPEDGIVHGHRRENLKSYMLRIALRFVEIHSQRKRQFHSNVSNVRTE